MAKTKKRALYLATESQYASDPSTNGSGYLPVPAMEIGDITDERNQLETNYSTGRGYQTAPIPGPDQVSFQFTVPLHGFPVAVRDGESPPSADWLDAILTHVFGEVAALDGTGILSENLPTSITMGADTYNVQDVLPLYDALSPTSGPKVHWAFVTADAGGGQYTVDPSPATIDLQGDALGHKRFRFSDDGGATLAFVYVEDDIEYTVLGGRITSAKISAEAGKIAMLELAVSADRRSVTTKASLPSAVSAPDVTPAVMTYSPVFFGGAEVTTRKVEIDFGLAAQPLGSTGGANGRAGHVYGERPKPTLTIEPLRVQSNLTAKHDVTTGRLMVQIGRGYHGSGSMPTADPVNSLCAVWGSAFVSQVALSDDGGIQRQTVTFEIADAVEFSAGVPAVVFQLLRA